MSRPPCLILPGLAVIAVVAILLPTPLDAIWLLIVVTTLVWFSVRLARSNGNDSSNSS